MRMKNIIKGFAFAAMLAVGMFVSGCGGGNSVEPFTLKLDPYPAQIGTSAEVLFVVQSNKTLAVGSDGKFLGTINVVRKITDYASLYTEVLGPNHDTVRIHFFGVRGAEYTLYFELINVDGEKQNISHTFTFP